MPKELPPQKYLQECFDYSLSTGHLAWKTRPIEHFKDVRSFNIWNTRFAGTVVGARHQRGHLQVGLDKKLYKQHRIIWKLIYGEAPEQVDHIDNDPSNNAINNLRSATNLENNQNKTLTKLNTSGLKGAFYNKIISKYYTQLRVGGQRICKGYYDTAAEAHSEYCELAKMYHGEFANNG